MGGAKGNRCFLMLGKEARECEEQWPESVVPCPGQRADFSLLSPYSHAFLGLFPDYTAPNVHSVRGLGCLGQARSGGAVERGPSEWPHGSRRMVASGCRGGRCLRLSKSCLRGAGLVWEPLWRARE